MEKTGVQKLARVLQAAVIIIFICNILALLLVPILVLAKPELEQIAISGQLPAPLPEDDIVRIPLPVLISAAWLMVWTDAYTTVLTLFLWVCGVCTAIILWQGKRVLDTILAGEPFSLKNGANMKRAAVCCFVISGAALVRLIWGLVYYQTIWPLLTYNALFVPVFLVGGLLFLVMSALFRQAAELKAENDLTI